MIKRLLTFIPVLVLLAIHVPAQASAVNFGTSGCSYRLGPHSLVRTSSGTLYACVLNTTNSVVEMWKYSGGSWSNVGTNQNCGWGGGSSSCAIDGNNQIDVVYYYWNGSSIFLYYNTFNTSTNAWGTASSIYTHTGGFSYYGCDIAIDSNNCSHVVFIGYSGVMTDCYMNNVGGSWNSPVYNFATSTIYHYIAVDTTNGTGHRYNIPQISCSYGTYTYSYLGNANNATSFTLAGTTLNNTQAAGCSLIIDANGQTTVLDYYNSSGHYTQTQYISGSGTWSGAWVKETNIMNDTSGINSVAAAVNGTTRYAFTAYSGSPYKIYYNTSSTYGTWGSSETTLESPSAASTISVLWSYANLQPYTTYGIDYLFTVGTGTGNLYWDNLPIAPSYSLVFEGVNNPAAVNGVATPACVNGVK